MTAEPRVSIENIVTHLGEAKDSVYRWIDRKGLPAHKVGRLWKFKLSQIDAWVEADGAGSAPFPDESGKATGDDQ